MVTNRQMKDQFLRVKRLEECLSEQTKTLHKMEMDRYGDGSELQFRHFTNVEWDTYHKRMKKVKEDLPEMDKLFDELSKDEGGEAILIPEEKTEENKCPNCGSGDTYIDKDIGCPPELMCNKCGYIIDDNYSDDLNQGKEKGDDDE